MSESTPSYTEDDIEVLEGLDPVKMRPDMYTRTDDPLHLVQEVIDNSTDEAIGGYATKINVTLQNDGGIKVQDNGRGIPVGHHKVKNKPVVEVVFSTLHAGGKL